jgi:hypothetical protein
MAGGIHDVAVRQPQVAVLGPKGCLTLSFTWDTP